MRGPDTRISRSVPIVTDYARTGLGQPEKSVAGFLGRMVGASMAFQVARPGGLHAVVVPVKLTTSEGNRVGVPRRKQLDRKANAEGSQYTIGPDDLGA